MARGTGPSTDGYRRRHRPFVILQAREIARAPARRGCDGRRILFDGERPVGMLQEKHSRRRAGNGVCERPGVRLGEEATLLCRAAPKGLDLLKGIADAGRGGDKRLGTNGGETLSYVAEEGL